MRRAPSFWYATPAILTLLAAACGEVTSGGTTAMSSGSPQDGGAGPWLIAGDAAAQALSVSIAPVAPQVCAGECVDLTATATGGTAPYTYTWTGAATTSGSTAHVCPSQSSTVSVVATDSSGANGEVPRPPLRGSASVAVPVTACGVDGGPALVEASTTPPSTLDLKCSDAWPSTSPINGGPGIRQADAAIAAVPGGGAVIGAAFVSSTTIGGSTLQAVGDIDLLVVQIDAECNVAWTRQFGGRGADVNVSAIAADASGDAIVAGYFQTAEASELPFGLGAVDFGSGAQAALSIAGFVVKLDGQGNTVWARVYGGSGEGTAFLVMLDVAGDVAGATLLAVRSDTAYDFASNAVPAADAGSEDSYLVTLGPDGSLISARPSEAFSDSAWVIDSVDAAPDGTAWLGGTGAFDQFVADMAGSSTLRALHVDGSGQVLSSQRVSATEGAPWNGAAVRVGPAGDVVVSAASAAGTSGVSWGRWFEGLSAAGDVVWAYPALAFWGSAWNPAALAKLDASHTAWTAGDFEGTLDLGSGFALTATGDLASDVVAIGPSGSVVSATVPALPADPVMADIALDGSGDVLLVGWAGSSPDMSLFVAKLGP
jgi:hypothetical protein